MAIAELLDIPSSRINVRVNRLGGGFGGEFTREAYELHHGGSLADPNRQRESISTTGSNHGARS